MNSTCPVFIDSDVVISSLLSSRGAAYFLLNQNQTGQKFFLSNISLQELKIVVNRLKIDKNRLDQLVKTKFTVIKMKESLLEIKKRYKKYTFDINDAHIIAGAEKAKTQFLISYNLKHFKIDLIKKNFGIIIYKPATFLQYLRSS